MFRPNEVLSKKYHVEPPVQDTIFELIVPTRLDDDGRPIPRSASKMLSKEVRVYDEQEGQYVSIGNVDSIRKVVDRDTGKEKSVYQLKRPIFINAQLKVPKEKVALYEYLCSYPTNESNPFRDKTKAPEFRLVNSTIALKQENDFGLLENLLKSAIYNQDYKVLVQVSKELGLKTKGDELTINSQIIKFVEEGKKLGTQRIGRCQQVIEAFKVQDPAIQKAARLLYLIKAETQGIVVYRPGTRKFIFNTAKGDPITEVPAKTNPMRHLMEFLGTANGKEALFIIRQTVSEGKKLEEVVEDLEEQKAQEAEIEAARKRQEEEAKLKAEAAKKATEEARKQAEAKAKAEAEANAKKAAEEKAKQQAVKQDQEAKPSK